MLIDAAAQVDDEPLDAADIALQPVIVSAKACHTVRVSMPQRHSENDKQNSAIIDDVCVQHRPVVRHQCLSHKRSFILNR